MSPLPNISQFGDMFRRLQTFKRFSPSSFFISPLSQSDTVAFDTPTSFARSVGRSLLFSRAIFKRACQVSILGNPNSEQVRYALTCCLGMPKISVMNDSKIIDELGGTSAVAKLCEVKPSSVSEWRTQGIPRARRQYMRLLRPDLFGPAPTCDCTQPQPMKEAA